MNSILFYNRSLQFKLTGCFLFVAILIISVLSVISYNTLVKRAYSAYDSELRTSAYAAQAIIGDDFLSMNNDHADDYDRIVSVLTDFNQKVGLDYIYSVYMKNGRIYYTSVNKSPDEIGRGDYKNWYHKEYEIVPAMMRKAFETSQIQYEEYQGEFGVFRSIFIPFRNSNGELHVIGADVSIAAIANMKKRVITNTLILAVILLLVSIIIAAWFSRKITHPVYVLNDTLTSLANGNWDLTRRLSIRSGDEIGMMAKAFNTFMAALQVKITDIDTAVNSVNNNCTELEHLMEEVSDRYDAQAHDVRAGATAVEELSASSQSVSGIVVAASGEMSQFGDLTESTVKTINLALNSIKAVQQEALIMTDKLAKLDQQAEDIHSIVEVIKDIADQTNLLALNAAIEAARAGDQGRGFAVVADEVRKLSERTATATIEIGTMIASIQTDTKDASDMMHHAVIGVDESTRFADQANESLENFKTNISKVSDGMAEITLLVNEQAKASEDLALNVTSLSEKADENKESTRCSVLEVNQLKGKADQLKDVVSLFKY
ncbi:hypothetical protein ABT56_07130 [Photobacterium aquae]|uniref:Chemotaxis protein n=1 Tax=Photobacterium aquae TaxID=1195763 RepID=A0A0J1H5E0_9GAMM|nr:methyl-accepting chemotaxis protein [Photobacterium aquae]KLV06921.1 hypothetical protein ABT56_07130 [Photobacterium aquae]